MTTLCQSTNKSLSSKKKSKSQKLSLQEKVDALKSSHDIEFYENVEFRRSYQHKINYFYVKNTKVQFEFCDDGFISVDGEKSDITWEYSDFTINRPCDVTFEALENLLNIANNEFKKIRDRIIETCELMKAAGGYALMSITPIELSHNLARVYYIDKFSNVTWFSSMSVSIVDDVDKLINPEIGEMLQDLEIKFRNSIERVGEIKQSIIDFVYKLLYQKYKNCFSTERYVTRVFTILSKETGKTFCFLQNQDGVVTIVDEFESLK